MSIFDREPFEELFDFTRHSNWYDCHWHIHDRSYDSDMKPSRLNDGAPLGMGEAFNSNDVHAALITDFPRTREEIHPPPFYEPYPVGAGYFNFLVNQFDFLCGFIGGGTTICPIMHDLQVSMTDGYVTKGDLIGAETDLEAAFNDLVQYGNLRGIGELVIRHISYHENHPSFEVKGDNPLWEVLFDLIADYQSSGRVLPVSIHIDVIIEGMEGSLFWNPFTDKFDVNGYLRELYLRHGILSIPPTVPENPKDGIEENWSAFRNELLPLAKSKGVKIVWEHIGRSPTGVSAEWFQDQLRELWGGFAVEDGEPGTLLRTDYRDTLYVTLSAIPYRQRMFGTDEIGLMRNIIVGGNFLARIIEPSWAELIKDYPEQFVMGSDNFFGDVGEMGQLPPDLQEQCNGFLHMFSADSTLSEQEALQVAYRNPRDLYGIS